MIPPAVQGSTNVGEVNDSVWFFDNATKAIWSLVSMPQSMDRWCDCMTGTLTMAWDRFSAYLTVVPVVPPMSLPMWEKLRWVQLLRMSPMHHRRVSDWESSPSLTTMWKLDLLVEWKAVALWDKPALFVGSSLNVSPSLYI